MSIRLKIALTVLSTLIVYTILVLSIQNIQLKGVFEKVEIQSATKDFNRVGTLFNKEQEKLKDLIYEYAVWDDTYQFMEEKDRDYIDTNYYDEYLNSKKLAIVIFFDKNNKLYFGKWKDKSEKWSEIDEKSTVPYPEKQFGIISFENKYYMYATHNILRNNKTGVHRGILVFFKEVKDVVLSVKEIATDVDFHYELFDNKGKYSELNISSGTNGNNNVSATNETVKMEKHLTDDKGRIIGVLVTEHSRELSKVWKGFLITMLVILFWTLVLVFIIQSYILKIIITKPIGKLADSLKNYQVVSSETDKIPYLDRTDEIGSLASSFKELKKNIYDGNKEIIRLNEFLENEVAERTNALVESNKQLILSDKIILETSESICITDLNGAIIRVNKAFVKSSGYIEEELIGKNPSILKSGKHNQKFYKDMWANIHETGSWSGEIWDRKKSGEVYPKWMNINTIYDDIGTPNYYIAISTDMRKMKSSEDKIRKLAYYDSLTDLPNRHLFREILDKAIKRSLRRGKATVLMFLDLDRFKVINDNLGHTTGDLVLIEVAKRLKNIIKNSDTVARLGGDEFTVILEDIEYDMEISPVAERIISEISKPIIIDDKELNIGASIGIAYSPVDDFTIEGLLMKADAAMYQAKEAGKGQYAYYSRKLQIQNSSYMHIEQLLKDTIKHNRFIALIQPKVMLDKESSYVVGGELLIRMKDENGAFISPVDFIKVAEDTGLIIPLGNWIIEEACRIIAEVKNLNIPIKVAVNTSLKQFESNTLVETLKKSIEKYKISPNFLEIEITESLFKSDLTKIREELMEIRKMGITIAIDDFGTGYSSLSTMTSLPIDVLKIDKSFTDNLVEGNGSELVTTIIGISENLGLKTVIEGVETIEQIELLRKHSPIIIQGYYYSRPITVKDFIYFYNHFHD